MATKGDEARVGSWARPFSLPLYLLIVFGLSWPFQIASVLWAEGLPWVFLLNSLSMVMVSVATVIAAKLVFKDGLAGAGWSLGRWTGHLAVVGFAAGLWILPYLLGLAVGAEPLPPSPSPGNVALMVALPFIILVPGFGEELGWRGYMLPRLLSTRRSARKAVLLHAVIWWAWHIPILARVGVQAGLEQAGAGAGSALLLVPVSVVVVVGLAAIPAILHGVFFAYVWLRTKSLAVATVYHAAYDGFRDGLSVFLGSGPLVAVWASAAILVVGALLLWRARWDELAAPARRDSPPGG